MKNTSSIAWRGNSETNEGSQENLREEIDAYVGGGGGRA